MLTIVGTGIRRPQQLTLEGMSAIKAAKRILHLTSTEKAIDALLEKLGARNRRSLEELYTLGTIDDDNYDRLACEVLREVEEWKNVALLLYGHPRLGVTLTRRLEAELGDVTVLPATSSFDTMINDLRRDPLEAGSVMVDATRMLLFELVVEPRLDYYVYHVDAIATRVLASHVGNGSRFDLLREYLLRFYPATHVAKIVSCEVGYGDRPECLEVTIGTLDRAEAEMARGASLFIPGIRPTKVDRRIYSLLRASSPVSKTTPSAL